MSTYSSLTLEISICVLSLLAYRFRVRYRSLLAFTRTLPFVVSAAIDIGVGKDWQRPWPSLTRTLPFAVFAAIGVGVGNDWQRRWPSLTRTLPFAVSAAIGVGVGKERQRPSDHLRRIPLHYGRRRIGVGRPHVHQRRRQGHARELEGLGGREGQAAHLANAQGSP